MYVFSIAAFTLYRSVEYLWQRAHGPENLNCLLSNPLKNSAKAYLHTEN